MFTDTDIAMAPFDVHEDASNPYITEIPERFVLDSEDDLDAAWGDWLELTFNSEA